MDLEVTYGHLQLLYMRGLHTRTIYVHVPIFTTSHLEDIKPGWPTGRSADFAAQSCQEILKDDASSSSGYYWIQSYSSPPVQMYCDMTRELRGNTGPWMRVAYVNMKDPTQSCPSGLDYGTTERERFCTRGSSTSNRCRSTYFTVHGVNYTKVCGRALGYQKGSPDAFGPYHFNPSRTIDDVYVEGLSITHGYGPRNHIWTFTAALHEVLTHPYYICPCTNIDNHGDIRVPPFIGEDYYCDTGAPTYYSQSSFYRNDPLWDGKGCGLRDTCCDRQGNQPWFCKTLDEPTTDTIEVRVCGWHSGADTNFQQLELYVQ